ncbi:hypothetical protein [Chelativorans sp.]|uniref:hypothetical protein n=1 Tax=Chelativorans sp. TaxID=2203393 RepID=UPI0028123AA2|nr:hypothetical protein [Chelativorans sp.]
MLRRDEKADGASETARLISRQIRHAENARFLRRLPGFELQRELPGSLLDLLCKLQEAESASAQRRHGTR